PARTVFVAVVVYREPATVRPARWPCAAEAAAQTLHPIRSSAQCRLPLLLAAEEQDAGGYVCVHADALVDHLVHVQRRQAREEARNLRRLELVEHVPAHFENGQTHVSVQVEAPVAR